MGLSTAQIIAQINRITDQYNGQNTAVIVRQVLTLMAQNYLNIEDIGDIVTDPPVFENVFGNDAKFPVKCVRNINRSDETNGFSVREELDAETLCLGTICYSEFAPNAAQKISKLIYDGSNDPELDAVYVDGTFSGPKIGAKWVPFTSEEDAFNNFKLFNENQIKYNQYEVVKHEIGGNLQFFEAKSELQISNFGPTFKIPAPTDSNNNIYWKPVSPPGSPFINYVFISRNAFLNTSIELGKTYEIYNRTNGQENIITSFDSPIAQYSNNARLEVTRGLFKYEIDTDTHSPLETIAAWEQGGQKFATVFYFATNGFAGRGFYKPKNYLPNSNSITTQDYTFEGATLTPSQSALVNKLDAGLFCNGVIYTNIDTAIAAANGAQIIVNGNWTITQPFTGSLTLYHPKTFNQSASVYIAQGLTLDLQTVFIENVNFGPIFQGSGRAKVKYAFPFHSNLSGIILDAATFGASSTGIHAYDKSYLDGIFGNGLVTLHDDAYATQNHDTAIIIDTSNLKTGWIKVTGQSQSGAAQNASINNIYYDGVKAYKAKQENFGFTLAQWNAIPAAGNAFWEQVFVSSAGGNAAYQPFGPLTATGEPGETFPLPVAAGSLAAVVAGPEHPTPQNPATTYLSSQYTLAADGLSFALKTQPADYTLPAGYRIEGLVSSVAGAGGGGGPTSETVSVAWIAGESNVDGLAPITDLSTSPLSNRTPLLTREFQRVRIWNPTAQQWQKLQVGVNEMGQDGPFESGGQTYQSGFGPEIGVAQRWEAGNATGNLYVLKTALGGTQISRWQKDSNDLYATLLTGYRDPAFAALTAANLAPNIAFFYWNQGINNASNTSGYQAALADFIGDITTDYLEADTPIIIAGAKGVPAITSQQEAYVAGADERTHFLPVESYVTIPQDIYHYNAVSMIKNGEIDIWDLALGVTTTPPSFTASYTTTAQDYTAKCGSGTGAAQTANGSGSTPAAAAANAKANAINQIVCQTLVTGQVAGYTMLPFASAGNELVNNAGIITANGSDPNYGYTGISTYYVAAGASARIMMQYRGPLGGGAPDAGNAILFFSSEPFEQGFPGVTNATGFYIDPASGGISYMDTLRQPINGSAGNNIYAENLVYVGLEVFGPTGAITTVSSQAAVDGTWNPIQNNVWKDPTKPLYIAIAVYGPSGKLYYVQGKGVVPIPQP